MTQYSTWHENETDHHEFYSGFRSSIFHTYLTLPSLYYYPATTIIATTMKVLYYLFLLQNCCLTGTLVSAKQRPLHVSITQRVRRWLQLGGTFGSPTHARPYDRVAGHAVFSVTTPYGSPYLSMEKLTEKEVAASKQPSDVSTSKQKSVVMEGQNQNRMVVLYFMDPDDAISVRAEMKQIEQMKATDIRLTAFSLAKAVRHASNLGNGLPTGAPINDLTGELNTEGALRYKIVPSKRQLYYAARCIGRERVGLRSENPADDAQAVVMGGISAVDKKGSVKRTPMQAATAHMEGYVGIPVFYNPSMQKRLPLLKRLLTGVQTETTLFFNYEDMMDAWNTMRQRHSKTNIPNEPKDVEVFNLMDVLTSMDRDLYSKEQTATISEKVKEPFTNRFVTNYAPSLARVTFVPSSRSTHYKECISKRGNGKCRLRPMR
jgi:hypothetical protein